MARPWSAFLGAHRANDGEVLGLAGELRQVRTEQHPRHGCLDRFEGAAIGVARLGVEGVGLARASGHPEQNARLAAVRVSGRVGRQRLDPAGSGGAQGTRGREPHHLPSGQLRDMAIRATHGDTPFAPDGRESSQLEIGRQVQVRSFLATQKGRVNGSGGTPARSRWPRRCRRVLSPAHRQFFSARQIEPRVPARRAAGGGSRWRGKGFRSEPACPETVP